VHGADHTGRGRKFHDLRGHYRDDCALSFAEGRRGATPRLKSITASGDPVRSQRGMAAMMKMHKLDIAAIKAACDG